MPEIPIIIATQDLYIAVSVLSGKLPSDKKQTVGRRVENSLLSLLELLVCAKHAPKGPKSPYLIKATALVEITTFMLRILLVQSLANETTLHQHQAKLNEIARMLGGWRKSVS
jgi:hypothetical protein